jgi:hypothetical protein
MFGGNAIAECPAINGMRWNAGSQSETDLLLVEHTELRLEINLTMQSRNTILTFGFATLRGAGGGGVPRPAFSQNGDPGRSHARCAHLSHRHRWLRMRR